MAYSTMQPGLQHALLKHVGYISWIEINPLHMGKHAVVLSEPVAKQSDRLTLIRILEQHVDKLTLVQIGEELAKALFTQGYSVYQIGVERRGGRELSFLTRPLPKKDEEDVRFFWARREGRRLGFTGFDPIYSCGKIVGYYHNFDRICSEAVNGTSAFTLLQAIKIFQSEGKEILSLGLSPLSGMEKGYDLAGPLQILSQLFYKYGEKIYPFKGNAGHKSKFCGKKKKVYVASNAGWFKTMIAAATACGLEV
ncbi:phosphatidylglycerol lysyltransferase domain-containing protein [Maridesulfovibrio sp.]|uniref:phosphatidylglycerol lysyltransferase domain-containing protein n=1 Tax=Maridesulfovibrio sp. TaxID=2795000 RepID=UPI002AA9545D|nr:phosphatidylglycerol lysyltransferase domain-containing protein [Maridesulfovibrio sp.]